MATSQAIAFLSYTRTDDEFHGGYITSFRKVLENAVHVVTGEKTFQVFQDVEGIVIGENWQKKLVDVIHRSSVLVPMVTPLFFNSKPCREEVTQFLDHEQSLERDDLILPIYFFTSARLEKEEEKAKDPLAVTLGQRQMFDWRERADIPLDQPAARKSMVELASQIAQRLDGLDTGARRRQRLRQGRCRRRHGGGRRCRRKRRGSRHVRPRRAVSRGVMTRWRPTPDSLPAWSTT